jgi:hypothetical protein
MESPTQDLLMVLLAFKVTYDGNDSQCLSYARKHLF